jgi:hypothetical protein
VIDVTAGTSVSIVVGIALDSVSDVESELCGVVRGIVVGTIGLRIEVRSGPPVLESEPEVPPVGSIVGDGISDEAVDKASELAVVPDELASRTEIDDTLMLSETLEVGASKVVSLVGRSEMIVSLALLTVEIAIMNPDVEFTTVSLGNGAVVGLSGSTMVPGTVGLTSVISDSEVLVSSESEFDIGTETCIGTSRVGAAEVVRSVGDSMVKLEDDKVSRDPVLEARPLSSVKSVGAAPEVELPLSESRPVDCGGSWGVVVSTP